MCVCVAIKYILLCRKQINNTERKNSLNKQCIIKIENNNMKGYYGFSFFVTTNNTLQRS